MIKTHLEKAFRRQVSHTAVKRHRWQHKTELSGDKWSVDDVLLGVTRHKSSSHKREHRKLTTDYIIPDLATTSYLI